MLNMVSQFHRNLRGFSLWLGGTIGWTRQFFLFAEELWPQPQELSTKTPRGNFGASVYGGSKNNGLSCMGMVVSTRICLNFVLLASNSFVTYQIDDFRTSVLHYKCNDSQPLCVCVCRNLLPAGLYKTTIAWKLREVKCHK